MKCITPTIIPILGLCCLQFSDVGAIEFTEHKITGSDFYEIAPALGEDSTGYLVAYEARSLLQNGNFDHGDIYYQRLDITGAPVGDKVRVTTSFTDDIQADVSGDNIVLTSYDEVLGRAGAIIIYEISDGTKRSLGSFSDIGGPKIHGNYVAWIQGPLNYKEIHLYDIDTNNTQIIAGPAPDIVDNTMLEIGNRFVVWVSRTRDFDINVFDLELGTSYALTDTPYSHEVFPSTSGDWVVWQTFDSTSPNGRIEAYNVRTDELRIIADGNGSGSNGYQPSKPSIDGDIIAYEAQVSAYDKDIFIYRISTGETLNATSRPGDQYLSDVYGNLLAYVDASAGDDDIYITQINVTQTPEEQVIALVEEVIQINIDAGISNSLDTKLDTTLKALEDVNVNNDVAALNSLYAFCSSVEAQRDNKITTEDADSLINSVNKIITSLDENAVICD